MFEVEMLQKDPGFFYFKRSEFFPFIGFPQQELC